LRIRISTDGGVPVYQQIVNQIKYLVASNVLHPGDEMPPIRALAEELLINPNTVARAYRELEVAGLVEKRGTVGTFVSSSPSRFTRRERLRILRQKVDALLAEASTLGIGVAEVKTVIDERASAMHGEPKAKRGSDEG
jgi:GntR family transcriptional regulator